MSLHARCERGSRAIPGWSFTRFSGDSREWQTVGAAFSAYPQLYIDLPGHGGSRDVRVSGFAEVSLRLEKTLAHYHVRDYWLIGYSLGGRIAMFCQPAAVRAVRAGRRGRPSRSPGCAPTPAARL